MLAQYSFRRSVLEKERSYSLFEDRIVIEGEELPARVYMFAEVQRVHLKYEHTKQREYYQCFVHTRGGRIDLRHVHYRGFADLEDRRFTYTPFVKALLAELARVPGVQFRAGSMSNFIAAIAGVPVMVGLTWLCVSLGRYGMGIFAAMMGGLAGIMIAPSKPRPLDPLAPPPDLLP